jgi:hypothetical protein
MAKTRRGEEVIEPVKQQRVPLAPDGTPDYAPTPIAPVTVEGDRPVIEAVTMRRLGEGDDPGLRAAGRDLIPQTVTRLDPMSMRDAAGAGLFESRVPAGVEIDPSAAFRAGLIRPFADRPERGQAGVAMGDLDTTNRIQGALAQARVADDAQMSTAAGRAMGEAMDLTRPERWGQSGPTRGARFSEVSSREDPRTGRRVVERVPLAPEDRAGTQDRARAVLDRERRIGEALATPKAVAAPGAGVAMFDPKTGKWDFGGRNEGESAPRGISSLDDAKVLEGLSRYGKPDKRRSKDELTVREQMEWDKMTPQQRDAMLERPWRPEDQDVYRQYESEARRRGLVGGERGGAAREEKPSGYSPEEAQALPPGTVYVGRDGKKYRR